jgi:Type II secretion system (T2SS), protein G
MKRALFVVAIVVALWFIYTSLVCVVSPKEMTATAIGESFARINLYANEHHKLPNAIADFPQRSGYMNRTEDGWGNPLLYKVANDGVITLSSFGADAKPGGIDDDEDVSRSYRSVGEHGRFIAGDDLWLVDGEIRAEN